MHEEWETERRQDGEERQKHWGAVLCNGCGTAWMGTCWYVPSRTRAALIPASGTWAGDWDFAASEARAAEKASQSAEGTRARPNSEWAVGD